VEEGEEEEEEEEETFIHTLQFDSNCVHGAAHTTAQRYTA
jgi:hypothetical protein